MNIKSLATMLFLRRDRHPEVTPQQHAATCILDAQVFHSCMKDFQKAQNKAKLTERKQRR